MCGIVGYSGDLTSEILKKMSFQISHRGPDDHGIWFDDNEGVGLAHRRLSIIDISAAGKQPMVDNNDFAVISFNGEIYNYVELRKELIAKGYRFRNTTDTEVILCLYLEYGENLLSKLNGIFSFAIWDKRKKILFLARDGMGVKPLYYTINRSFFAFASELKSLLEIPNIQKDINSDAIHNYVSYLWSPAPNTMISSIKKLEPGNALIIKNGEIKKKWQFYEIPYNIGIDLTRSLPDTIEMLDEKLRQAVERQMVADVPVGTFLSGGLDSTAITKYACDIHNDVQSFTIGFMDNLVSKEGFADDLPYAKKAASHLNVDLNIVSVNSDIINKLNFMIYHLDEPQADPAPLNLYYICKLAKEKGIKVLLSGAGGDDIFTGYRRHYALQKEKYWSWMPQMVRETLKNSTEYLPTSSPHLRRIKKAFSYADLSGDERIASYFHWIKPSLQNKLYSDDFKNTINGRAFSEPLMKTLSAMSHNTDPLNKMLFLEAKHFLADHNLNYTDKLSMATGIEVRVPFLDPDLVSFAYSLPLNYKQNGRVGKWIFKKTMEKYLPESIIYRPKAGFGAPMRGWINNELLPIVNDILSKESLEKRGIFNYKEVQKMILLNRNNKIDATYPIFSLLCIELWFRIFIDKRISI